MQIVTDSNGRGWEFQLNFSVAKRINAKLGIDIVDGDPSLVFHEYGTKPSSRLESLWLMLTKPIKQDEFDSILEGGLMPQLTEAFWNELNFFTQSFDPSRSEALNQMVKNQKHASQKQTELMMELANSPEAVEAMDRVLTQAKDKFKKELGDLSIESLEHSALTQTP